MSSDDSSGLSKSVRTYTLIKRSEVTKGLPYNEYKKPLRYDFYYSCAYCTLTECEAEAIRFTIDHYEPQTSRADLVNEYENLMYCCDECNTRKGDRSPPETARQEGYRFFRPDKDLRDEHFELKGIRLAHKSNTAYYTIEALDLNRQTLRRLRELRQRLTSCDLYVAEGITALRNLSVDQLPVQIKAQAARAIRSALQTADALTEKIDDLLRSAAASHVVGTNDDGDATAREKERMDRLKQLEGMYPGKWRGRKKS
jgi:5-methylcytosine-specific restriction endonuclease McrA